jgi:hypothetical protein
MPVTEPLGPTMRAATNELASTRSGLEDAHPRFQSREQEELGTELAEKPSLIDQALEFLFRVAERVWIRGFVPD